MIERCFFLEFTCKTKSQKLHILLQVRRDWFAYSVLSALPWVGRELYEKKESELDRMLGSLEGYIKRRNKTHHTALRVFRSDNPHPQEEVSWLVS